MLRYRFGGRAREMGLGAASAITLAQARDRAAEARQLLTSGVDPIASRAAGKAALRTALCKPETPTFDEAVKAYIKANSAAWKNLKHSQQWANTLAAYASPHFGKWPVDEVDLAVLVEALAPIWASKPETASRVRGRIEKVLDWATVLKHRVGDNPARWKGNLDKVLPSQNKVRSVKHHLALPYAEMPRFVPLLRAQAGVAAEALWFAILTAGRTSEILGARWSEFDLQAKLWTIPAERMKMGKEHRVPLSSAAVLLLENRPQTEGEALVFPHPLSGKALSVNAMRSVLVRMKVAATAHGFRSTFSDWAAETTRHTNEVIEMALAHQVPNKVEAAYRRGDLFEKRRDLMKDWALFLDGNKECRS